MLSPTQNHLQFVTLPLSAVRGFSAVHLEPSVAALIDEGWSWSKDHRKMLNLGLFLPPKGSSGGGKIRFNSSVHDTATGNHIRNAASNKRQSRNPRRKNNRNDKANDPTLPTGSTIAPIATLPSNADTSRALQLCTAQWVARNRRTDTCRIV